MDKLELCLGFFEMSEDKRVVWAARPPKMFFSHQGWADWYVRNRAGEPVKFYKGSQMGHRSVKVRAGGRDHSLQEHRIVWALAYGEYPAIDLDHINGDPSDNRLSNLRPATRGENAHNRRRRKPGLKGAYWHPKGHWFSMVWDGKRLRGLGRYASAQEAHEAWVKAKAPIAGRFLHVGYPSVFD